MTTPCVGRSISRQVVGANVVFTFPQIDGCGDCQIAAGATLTLKPNGRFDWSAQVKSTDTNDTWKMHIYIYRSDGSVLFQLPNIDDVRWKYSFDIGDSNVWKSWTVVDGDPDGPVNANVLDADHVAISSDC